MLIVQKRCGKVLPYRGAYGPEHWVTSSVSCGGRHQSPIDILDHQARVGEEYQELQLDGFDSESSNKTWMKNTGKTEKETFLDPFVLRDLLPASLGSYYRYTGSLTTPPCSEIVEWIVFQKPVPISYHQLEAFYSIFTTEQQDHVKSVEYLRNNFRPQQALNDRVVSKSAVRDAWSHDMADFLENPLGTEASKGKFGLSALARRKIP
ncbi:Receptor-type tyrosine-protein phosphatase gamma [Heterocephalus glaber]|uniref:Receptor-type tyrosine-protein phosphatase gamma n=1 Tax=Heterocephalus glaber TaxID=10181 RepID=G5C282_HETGA|nr:Receptor-type tyrosine-protein phosphatase gamma [Heterocephalus glaber]